MRTISRSLLALSLISGQGLMAQEADQFYYPISDLEAPVSYVYTDVGTNEVSHYLYVYTIMAASDTFLITESYGADLEKQDYRKERITPQGSELVKYVRYEGGEEVKADILESDVFPFDLGTDNHTSYKVEYDQNGDQVQVWKVGNLYSEETVLNDFEGKTYECIELTEFFMIKNKDADRTVIFYNISTYYEGLGLMHVERYEQGNVQVFEEEVTEILTEMEWKEISGQR